MWIRLTTLIWLALASLAGIGLFQQAKYRVQSLEGDLGQIDRQILRDQEAIHVLGAEWSLLNGAGAHRRHEPPSHPAATPFTAAQLAHFTDLPDRIAPPPAAPGDPMTIVPTTAPLVALGVPMAALPAAALPVAAAPAATLPAAAAPAVPTAAQPAAPAPSVPTVVRPVATAPSVAALPENDADVAAVLASMRSSQ